jgi:hypothetical protein
VKQARPFVFLQLSAGGGGNVVDGGNGGRRTKYKRLLGEYFLIPRTFLLNFSLRYCKDPHNRTHGPTRAQGFCLSL